MLLVYWNLLPYPLLNISAFFEKHRENYYTQLLEVSQRGQWKAWILFFLDSIIEGSRNAIIAAKKLQELQQRWRDTLTKARASGTVIALADKLFESPILTIPNAQKKLNVSYPTAKRSVERLAEVGILTQLGESKYDRVFIAGDFFSDIENIEDLLAGIKVFGRLR